MCRRRFLGGLLAGLGAACVPKALVPAASAVDSLAADPLALIPASPVCAYPTGGRVAFTYRGVHLDWVHYTVTWDGTALRGFRNGQPTLVNTVPAYTINLRTRGAKDLPVIPRWFAPEAPLRGLVTNVAAWAEARQGPAPKGWTF